MSTSEQVVSTIEEAKEYIYSLNFDKIIDKMVKDGWIKIDAEKTCTMFRNFLFLYKKYPKFEHLVPSKDVDEFWHTLILDTAFYRQICKTLFYFECPDKNGYLDHYPYFGIDEHSNSETLNEAFNSTQALFAKEFGEKQIMVPTRSKFPKSVYWLLRKIS